MKTLFGHLAGHNKGCQCISWYATKFIAILCLILAENISQANPLLLGQNVFQSADGLRQWCEAIKEKHVLVLGRFQECSLLGRDSKEGVSRLYESVTSFVFLGQKTPDKSKEETRNKGQNNGVFAQADDEKFHFFYLLPVLSALWFCFFWPMLMLSNVGPVLPLRTCLQLRSAQRQRSAPGLGSAYFLFAV